MLSLFVRYERWIIFSAAFRLSGDKILLGIIFDFSFIGVKTVKRYAIDAFFSVLAYFNQVLIAH